MLKETIRRRDSRGAGRTAAASPLPRDASPVGYATATRSTAGRVDICGSSGCPEYGCVRWRTRENYRASESELVMGKKRPVRRSLAPEPKREANPLAVGLTMRLQRHHDCCGRSFPSAARYVRAVLPG